MGAEEESSPKPLKREPMGWCGRYGLRAPQVILMCRRAGPIRLGTEQRVISDWAQLGSIGIHCLVATSRSLLLQVPCVCLDGAREVPPVWLKVRLQIPLPL